MTERLIFARRRREAQLLGYTEHVQNYRDLGLKISFLNSKKTAKGTTKEQDDEQFHMSDRRNQLKALYHDEEREFESCLERDQRVATERREKELEEHAETVIKENELERLRFVREKRFQQETLNSEAIRVEASRKLHEEQRNILEKQLEEKQKRLALEREEASVFGALWQRECSKRENREQSDLDATNRRNMELRGIIEGQLTEKRNAVKEHDQAEFPDNCFWNGTLTSKAPVRIKPIAPHVAILQPKPEQSNEDAVMIQKLVEEERLRTERELAVKALQRETMKHFHQEAILEKLRKAEENEIVDQMVNSLCKKVNDEAISREDEARKKRDDLLKRTLEERSAQVASHQEDLEKQRKVRETEREAQRIALENEKVMKSQQQAALEEKRKSYRTSLIHQIESRNREAHSSN